VRSAQFFPDRIFTPGRAALLAAELPATDANATARRDTAAAALRIRIRIKKLDTTQNAQITALEELPADPAVNRPDFCAYFQDWEGWHVSCLSGTTRTPGPRRSGWSASMQGITRRSTRRSPRWPGG
jgi:hypothetical protein